MKAEPSKDINKETNMFGVIFGTILAWVGVGMNNSSLTLIGLFMFWLSLPKDER